MSKAYFSVLLPLALVSHFATAQVPVAVPIEQQNQFRPMVGGGPNDPPVVPGDVGPPGALQAQQQQQIEQARAQMAARQAAINTPNVGRNTKDPSALLQQFMSMFNGGGKGGKAVPDPYLPNGQPNPAFDEYIRGGGSVPSGTVESNNNFVSQPGGKELDQEYSSMCKYSLANANKNFAGWNCNTPTKDRMTCMVCNLFYEAGVEPAEGQVAVGRSSLRRLMSKQYAAEGEGLCDVVYRKSRVKSGRWVAQYSWTLENKNHVLPAGANLNRVVASAKASFCAGPNEFTNYFAPSIVNPAWNQSGPCTQPPRRLYPGPTGGHQFCKIGGNMDRRIEEVMASEGARAYSGSAEDTTTDR